MEPASGHRFLQRHFHVHRGLPPEGEEAGRVRAREKQSSIIGWKLGGRHRKSEPNSCSRDPSRKNCASLRSLSNHAKARIPLEIFMNKKSAE